jgi:hypothetical protein
MDEGRTLLSNERDNQEPTVEEGGENWASLQTINIYL